MSKQDNVIFLYDGQIVRSVGAFDLKHSLGVANSNEGISIKVGTKVFKKHVIAAVAPYEALNGEAKNMVIQIGGKNLYTNIKEEEVENKLDQFVEESNSELFADFNGIMINRNSYDLIEKLVVESEGE